MAANHKSLGICSYNLHGFKSGMPFLKSLCLNNDLIFVQEHWLQSSQLHLFNTIDDDFVFLGKSAMDDRIASGLLRGRPFGGIGVMVRQNLCSSIKLHDVDSSCRVIVLKLDNDIIMFGVYLPCDDNSNEYINSLHQIIGYIDSCIEMFPGCKYILLGDFNFECKISSRGFREFNAFAKDSNLVVCDAPGYTYTYHHATLDQKSLIDHVFVHHDLKDSINDCNVIYDGANLSDHSPIQFRLLYSIDRCFHSENTPPRHINEYRWDKGDLWNYYLYSGALLNKINQSFDCADVNQGCTKASHQIDIEIYYAEIVHCLKSAAHEFVPRIPKSALKHYWSIALDELKQDSYNAHETWLAAGKPHNGDIHDLKKNAHYKYKLAVKDAMTSFESRFTEDLLDHYIHKDFNKFWEIWKKKTNKGPPVIPHVEGATENIDIANKFANFFSMSDTRSTFNFCDNQIESTTRRNDDVSLLSDCSNWLLTVEDVDKAVRNNLRIGKAAGIDNIVAEHIIHAHPAIIYQLTKLFNQLILHSYVPNTFGHAIFYSSPR